MDAKDGNISWRVTETVEPETELIEDQDGIHDVIKSDNEDENTSNVNRRIPESVFVDID